MEGNWRVACLVGVVLACCLAAAGCGSDSSGSSAEGVKTLDPDATFAPLVQLDPEERWLPMDADWFLNRSVFGFADDQGCADRPIAIGDELEHLWTPAVDWLGQSGLGTAAGTNAYFRTPYAAATPDHDVEATGIPCPFREGYRIFANQQTRPHEKKDRVPGVRLTEGYYVDLVDRARGGQRARPAGEGFKTIAAPAYVERNAEEVDGESGLRLTYWLLYGMHAPLDAQGEPIEPRTHEGDWERVDVLLQEGGDDDEWVPVAVRLVDAAGRRRDVPWASIRRAPTGDSSPGGASSRSAKVSGASTSDTKASGAPTHPVLSATRGDHTLSPAPRGDDCAACPQWPTWSSLATAAKQPWYGFGGAWGQPGKTSATTGPLGPHDKWAPDSPFNAET